MLCPAYQAIKEAFTMGKPQNILPADHPALRLKEVWHHLSLAEEGLLMVNRCRIYIPPSARRATLEDLHQSHCRSSKTLETGRQLYYWPSMKHDIRALIEKCEACQQLWPSKPKEPLIHTSASFSMEKISIDLFHLGKKNYMITADRFSGYIWVDLLRELSTKAVTDAQGNITLFSITIDCSAHITSLIIIQEHHGIPISRRTDSGPQFRGPFNKYCESQGITHKTSSPYNLQSNGHAEAAVKAAKHLLMKADKATFPQALAAWRNTCWADSSQQYREDLRSHNRRRSPPEKKSQIYQKEILTNIICTVCTFCALSIIIYLSWHELQQLFKAALHTLKQLWDQATASPVKNTRQVEAEYHQDLIELWFDHLAVGGTALIMPFAIIILYLICKKRSTARGRQDVQAIQSGNYPLMFHGPQNQHSMPLSTMWQQMEMMLVLQSMSHQSAEPHQPFYHPRRLHREPTNATRFIELPPE